MSLKLDRARSAAQKWMLNAIRWKGTETLRWKEREDVVFQGTVYLNSLMELNGC